MSVKLFFPSHGRLFWYLVDLLSIIIRRITFFETIFAQPLPFILVRVACRSYDYYNSSGNIFFGDFEIEH